MPSATPSLPYLDSSDLVARFGEQEVLLAFEVDSLAALSSQIVAQRVDSAAALINAHIGARYQIPLPSPVPELIRRIAAAIVRYDYHTLETRERVEAPYRDAIRTLREIREGRLDLSVPHALSPNSPRFRRGNRLS